MNLGNQRRSMVHQPLAATMKCLDILLLKRLPWNKYHVGLSYRAADCSSIIAIVFLLLGERLDVLRGNDPNPMPRSLEESTSTGFHSNRARYERFNLKHRSVTLYPPL